MSEEETKEEEQEITIAEFICILLGITSFVLGLFSFRIMLVLFVDILCLSYFWGVVFEFFNIDGSSFDKIFFYSFYLAIPSAIFSLLFGIIAYIPLDRKDYPVSKVFAKWGIILSIFYWVLFYIQCNTLG